jgi:hypothetical protein
MLVKVQQITSTHSAAKIKRKPAKAQQIRQQLQQAVAGNEQAKHQRKAKFPVRYPSPL